MATDVRAILFAAYEIAHEKASSLLKTIAVVGLAISAAVFVGVVAGLLAKVYTWLDFRSMPGNEREPFWVRTWITFMAFVPDLGFP